MVFSREVVWTDYSGRKPCQPAQIFRTVIRPQPLHFSVDPQPLAPRCLQTYPSLLVTSAGSGNNDSDTFRTNQAQLTTEFPSGRRKIAKSERRVVEIMILPA